MENLKKAGIDTRILKIAEMVLHQFVDNQIGNHFTVDIDSFDLSVGSLKINLLEIKKIDEDIDRANVCLVPINENGINKIKIEAGSAGGLAHEISHLVFKCKNIGERMSILLTDHIGETCNTSGCEILITNYFKIKTLTNFDKLIGYLYLSDEDELVAKLAGFYIGAKLINNKFGDVNKYVQEVKSIYSEMQVFDINVLEVNKQEENIIVEYLNLREPINSDIIKAHLKKMHAQGESFEKKCNILGV